MYKHPYFDHPYFTSIRNDDHPNDAIPTFEQDPNKPAFITKFPAIKDHSISGKYVPTVVDPMLSNPIWMQGDPYLCEAIAGRFNHMIPSAGYTVDIDGRICCNNFDAANVNGFICAQAIQLHDDGIIGYPTYVVNTADAGLRMVVLNEEGKCPMDNGPVEDMMIFGNEKRPEGIYVPFCNAKAMADAVFLITSDLSNYEHQLISDLNDAASKRIPEAHKCKCGGNCKCKHEHDDFDL